MWHSIAYATRISVLRTSRMTEGLLLCRSFRYIHPYGGILVANSDLNRFPQSADSGRGPHLERDMCLYPETSCPTVHGRSAGQQWPWRPWSTENTGEHASCCVGEARQPRLASAETRRADREDYDRWGQYPIAGVLCT
jgi:hypothetical protein